jgi:hypothetical protein
VNQITADASNRANQPQDQKNNQNRPQHIAISFAVSRTLVSRMIPRG